MPQYVLPNLIKPPQPSLEKYIAIFKESLNFTYADKSSRQSWQRWVWWAAWLPRLKRRSKDALIVADNYITMYSVQSQWLLKWKLVPQRCWLWWWWWWWWCRWWWYWWRLWSLPQLWWLVFTIQPDSSPKPKSSGVEIAAREHVGGAKEASPASTGRWIFGCNYNHVS